MNVNSLKNKKSLKIVTLLVSALLIATVSADVYYSLSMTSTISVAANDVYFKSGTDSTAAGATLGADNTTVSFTGLKAYPNATTTYSQAVIIRNNATSGTTNIRLRPVSLTGDAADFVFVNFTLVDPSLASQGSLNYTSSGGSWTTPSETSFVPISASTEWSVKIETMAAAGATSGSATIVIAVDVQ
jgi:hypothetical protein